MKIFLDIHIPMSYYNDATVFTKQLYGKEQKYDSDRDSERSYLPIQNQDQ